MINDQKKRVKMFWVFHYCDKIISYTSAYHIILCCLSVCYQWIENIRRAFLNLVVKSSMSVGEQSPQTTLPCRELVQMKSLCFFHLVYVFAVSSFKTWVPQSNCQCLVTFCISDSICWGFNWFFTSQHKTVPCCLRVCGGTRRKGCQGKHFQDE